MKLIPFEKYSFRCSLTPEQFALKLLEYTEPKKFFRFGLSDKIFQGSVENDRFSIMRIISYRNSFLPKINGQVECDGEVSNVRIKMSLHPFVSVFLTVWFSGVFLFLFGALLVFFNKLRNGQIEVDGFLVIPAVLLVFGIALCSISFRIEVNKARREIDRIFSVYME